MALTSMTGFGRGDATVAEWKAEVELSSVNRKQFDVRVNLPRSLAAMESMVTAAIHKLITRGHISAAVRIQMSSGAAGAVAIDMAVAREGVRQIRAAASLLGLPDDLTAGSLLLIPEVVHRNAAPEDVEQAWPLVSRALTAALGQLVAMRAEEGHALERDLVARLERLGRLAARIKRSAPRVAKRYRQALLKRIAESGVSVASDDPALLRELAFFADRCDISEELTRLDSHFSQADALIGSSKPAGRSLDFLCQEMYREINTIGSKANDAAIAREVIQFKAELEAVREQVQNVE